MKTVELAGAKWQWSDDDRSCYKYLEKRWRDVFTAVNFVPKDRRNICVQAGGNFGVWPALLSERFARVITFEPEPVCFDCLIQNTRNMMNVEAYKFGLSDRITSGEFVMEPGNRGAQHLKFNEGSVPCIPLDSFALPGLDLLDLDIEGAEALALEGAKETVLKYKPVVVVENWTKNDKPGHHAVNYSGIQSGSQWLEAHGYEKVGRISQDDVYAFPS